MFWYTAQSEIPGRDLSFSSKSMVKMWTVFLPSGATKSRNTVVKRYLPSDAVENGESIQESNSRPHSIVICLFVFRTVTSEKGVDKFAEILDSRTTNVSLNKDENRFAAARNQELNGLIWWNFLLRETMRRPIDTVSTILFS